jgi:predicted outer membrane repeat protein
MSHGNPAPARKKSSTANSVAGLRHRGARVAAVAAAGVLAAGCGLWAGVSPAAAATVLYAAVTPSGTADCSTVANACDLTTALADVPPGGTIELVTSGDTARYVGNWTVSSSGTSASQPVTIQAESGLDAQPILDGNGPLAPPGQTCSTPSCVGSILTVPSGAFVNVTGLTFADGIDPAGNTSSGDGGAIVSGGSLTVTGSTFVDNAGQVAGGAIFSGGPSGTASLTVTGSTFDTNTIADASIRGGLGGGAIFNGDGSTATVSQSTFTNNQVDSGGGGAIDTADGTNGYAETAGPMTISASTFTGNTAGEQVGMGYGGAIDSGYGNFRDQGPVTVSDSTFSGNIANTDGGAIDSGDESGAGTVSVAASTFAFNAA